jgi:hypothetical protein
VAATGNDEMARIHRELTERIRIIRRLDFTKEQRVDTTYQACQDPARGVAATRRPGATPAALGPHIKESEAEVRSPFTCCTPRARPRPDAPRAAGRRKCPAFHAIDINSGG